MLQRFYRIWPFNGKTQQTRFKNMFNDILNVCEWGAGKESAVGRWASMEQARETFLVN